MGSLLLIILSIGISDVRGHIGDEVKHRLSFYVGITSGIPVLVLLILGRNNVFLYMARKLESDNRNRSGEICTRMIAHVFGHNYRDIGHNFYTQNDKKEWIRGKIIDKKLDDDNVKMVYIIETDEGKRVQKSVVDYMPPGSLENARKKLRYVSWDKISEKINDDKGIGKKIFTGSQRELKSDDMRFYNFSEDVHSDKGKDDLSKSNGNIDYFISHAWADDDDKAGNESKKFELLKDVVKEFYDEHNRYPTFWLDKLCVPPMEGDEVHDSLKTLPLTIQSCNKMVVLLGKEYPERLWCLWELCTLLFMSDSSTSLEVVKERIKIKVIDTDNEGKGKEWLEKMKKSKLEILKCFDRNEQESLKVLMNKVGKTDFETTISKVADILIDSLDQENSRSSDWRGRNSFSPQRSHRYS